MDYKNTVLLPKTDFPMKGNLNTKEPEIILKWKEKSVYQKLLEKNKNKKKFTLPDGPPYANGSIHVGHAFNKILKDIIIKYKNMSGYQAPFIPGWDCHGLPIEHAVLKNLGPKAKEKTNSEIRQLCREEANKWVQHQKPQFERLGVLADWENPYRTMDPNYEAEQIRVFANIYEKGLVYLGTKPVYWNWTLKTALADAEVEYHQHKSPSIFVKFPITDKKTLDKLKVQSNKTYFAIWTTTPWTLPANLGVCLHPDFEYGVFESTTDNITENFIFVKSLKEFLEKELQRQFSLKHSFKGADLDRALARHPFLDRDSLVVLGKHVTQDAGTGCVHTAPGHGTDDYKVGLEYDLPVLSPVDEAGCYTDEFPEMKGTNIFKANPLIIEQLRSLNLLLSYKEFEHSYPHCWRSKTPLIYRATPQWFIGLDIEKNNIRNLALNEMTKIQFFPDWGAARFKAMLENRPDWCLSRQRIWGVPIPIFYCKKTGKPLAEKSVMLKVADVIEAEGGIDAFYQKPEEYFTSHIKPTGEFGSEGFKRGPDIFDVWFDSGICHSAVQKKRNGLEYPADIYLEGSDQHRGWFNTSLLSGLCAEGSSPFKALLTHGFVNDSNGFKMSKSKGNVVDPNQIASTSGAEILRLWAIYEDYGGDVKCGKQEFDRVTETYRRLRNTMKFLLGSLDDFDFKQDSVPVEKMTLLDQWALHKLNEVITKSKDCFDQFTFNKIYHLVNTFVTVDLSAVYLDVLKDRLYTWKKDGVERRSAQTVIYHITENLIKILAPVLSFLSEESYSYFSGKKYDSVFLEDFPSPQPQWKNNSLSELMDSILQVRAETQKVLENLRASKEIGSSLDAVVKLTVPAETLNKMRSFDKNIGLKSSLRELFIVSELHLTEGPISVVATKSNEKKCVRCWIYSDSIGQAQQHPEICTKCVEAIA